MGLPHTLTVHGIEQVPFLRQPLFADRLPLYDSIEGLSSVIGLCIILYVYDRWMTAGGFQIWAWRKPSWRSYLWLFIFGGCLAEAILKNHAVHGIESFHLLQREHFTFVLTSFVRNVLLALCGVSLFG